MSYPPVPVCDFCLVPNPQWSFDTKCGSTFFETGELPKELEGVPVTASAAWSACGRCATIIIAKDIDRLVTVVVTRAERIGIHAMHGLTIESETARLTKLYRRVIPLFGARRRQSQQDLREFKRPLQVTSVNLDRPENPGMN